MTDPFRASPKLGYAPTVTPPGHWRAGPGGSFEIAAPPARAPRPGSGAASGVTTTPEVATAPDGPPVHRPRRRWLVGLIAVPIVAAGAATALILLQRGGDDAGGGDTPVVAGEAPLPTAVSGAQPSSPAQPASSGDPSSATSAPAPASVPAPPVTPAPDRVVIQFEVDPSDAAITVEGERLTGTELDVPRADREVEVAVTRDGYKPKIRRVSLGASRTVEVILEKGRDPRGRGHRPRRGKENRGEERIISESPYD
jgi:hypothetical protein